MTSLEYGLVHHNNCLIFVMTLIPLANFAGTLKTEAYFISGLFGSDSHNRGIANYLQRTFQKKMNLHLYIPPPSTHPSGCIKGTIFGLVCRYYAQNTYHRDFVHFVQLLYYRLLNQGWQRELSAQ